MMMKMLKMVSFPVVCPIAVLAVPILTHSVDEFISDRPERRQAPGSGMEAMFGNDGNENEEFESGDASHRMLDRRINAAADRKAREEAAGFRTRHGKSNYNGDGADEWAPKALLMPGVNDPSVWGVKCKVCTIFREIKLTALTII